ncbi:hypothetical protein [Polyangium sp. 6x1]|uniref:hypothetical protein n=1 Tax=Polyangium sp. 6x1 TaxID=3042689 RepID=UPI0024822CE1|nr:hypothetical protein [Polyangium sp. 6x1]MDI1451182.1 hypothetical protein [Polyangium sp. 6x1]
MTNPRYLPRGARLPLLTLLLGLAAVPACSTDVVEQISGSATSGAGAAGGTGGTGGSDGTGGSVDTGGMGGTGGTGGSVGTGGSGPVACMKREDCAETEYCDFADNRCGEGEAHGVCELRPIECSFGGGRVCGCNGKVQLFDCPQMQDAVDISVNGNCETPSDSFACGYTYCLNGVSYCYEHAGLDPVYFSCDYFPEPCNSADPCSCLQLGFFCQGVTCTTDAEGHTFVRCPP